MSAKEVKLTFGKGKTHLAHQATLNLLVAGFDVEVVPITIIVRSPQIKLSNKQRDMLSQSLRSLAENFQEDGVEAEIVEE